MNQQPSGAARSAALCNLAPHVFVGLGIVLILLLESIGIRVLLGVVTLAVAVWLASGRTTQPNMRVDMINTLLQDDDGLQILPNHKYSTYGFPTVEKPFDFALTLKTSLTREAALGRLAAFFEECPGATVVRMEDPLTEGRRLDLVVYPDAGTTTQYHVAVSARNPRPKMLRIRLRKV